MAHVAEEALPAASAGIETKGAPATQASQPHGYLSRVHKLHLRGFCTMYSFRTLTSRELDTYRRKSEVLCEETRIVMTAFALQASHRHKWPRWWYKGWWGPPLSILTGIDELRIRIIGRYLYK